MTTADAYDLMCRKQPPLIYLTGKTSVGKTTFSDRLKDSCGYEVIELDKLVHDTIIEPLCLHSGHDDVFLSVYKTADRPEWIDIFVTETQKRVRGLLEQGQRVIVDGAIANPGVVRRIFDSLPESTFIYFHPSETSINYRRNLTNRFLDTTAQNHNGLPKAFWDCIDQDLFARFCDDRIITSQLEKGIARYALRSSQESVKRLKALQESFPHIVVVVL